MAKQTFTTGQVLTAAQMTSLQQTAMGGGSTTAKTASYTLVAADAGTVIQMNSASATTITVNTALFAAGDTVQIQNVGAGVCTVTAGTATVSTAGSLALSQYEGGQLYFNTTSAALFFDIVQSGSTLGPTFNAYLSANQTVTSNVITKVQINTEEYDLGSCYDNATNYRFTPTTAGIYQVNLTVQANGSSGTTIWLYKNGASIGELARTAGAGSPISGSRFVTMNGTTDYIEFFAQVASGTIVYGGQGTTIFGAAYLRSN